ncbi:baseplate J/gp47 family protein [Leptospira santarosai]|uniref:baseplate J/gp47 family protein n=1 Tax=Leptospira santarosai TaxID=28183 RepID=UPI0024AE9E27|nr:baseplate J/gp47 family protein [Leptospira santarosai]MDI7165966.1 baseplate J/gp47 family protein [Leptospira santarosai]
MGFFTNLVSYLVAAKVRLTNFKPGSRIRTILEAIAAVLSRNESEFYVAYLYSIRNSCYESFGFGLLEGKKSTGFVRFEKTDHTSTYSIPIFTISLFGQEYQSVAPSNITVGQTFVDIDIRALNSGSQYNLDSQGIDTNLGKGDVFPSADRNSSLVFDRIYNPFLISGGTDQETEEERLIRWQEFVNNLGRSTLAGILSGVKSVSGVVDCYVTENLNPSNGQPETGWINIYVSDGTSNTAPAIIQTVTDKIKGIPGTAEFGYKAGGTRLFVGNLLVQPISFHYELDVLISTQISDTQFKVLVEQAIANYVNKLRNGGDVIFDRLKGAGINAHPDIQRIRFVGISNDFVVPLGSVPKIGGSGGGSIVCDLINRINQP